MVNTTIQIHTAAGTVLEPGLTQSPHSYATYARVLPNWEMEKVWGQMGMKPASPEPQQHVAISTSTPTAPPGDSSIFILTSEQGSYLPDMAAHVCNLST